MYEGETVEGEAPKSLTVKATNEEEPVGEPFVLEEGILDVVKDQVEQSGPNECCGFIVHVDGRDQVFPVSNQVLKSDKPDRAKYSYAIDSEELYWVLKYVQDKGGRIAAVYHSHPNHEKAHFSGADRSLAVSTTTGKPILENVAQLVFAAKDGVIKDSAAYRWNPIARDYSKAPLIMPPTKSV